MRETPTVVIAGMAGALALSLSACGKEVECTGEQTVVVQPGDTSWTLANEYVGVEQPKDFQEVMGHVRRLNPDEEIGTIHPGDVLILPEEC